MSDKTDKEEKISLEELKKLEDEAYFELCQIIAEAMQLQDIELLDYRISVWKKKYKKLLDNPKVGSKFKKRIEFLLNEYYSSITLYIWQQLKRQERKRIEKQYKAIRKLYTIIDETNDIKQLEKAIENWKKKYPVDAFLDMYQKKIKRLTSERNIKENAFDQDQAFYDLYRITKINGTIDELKQEVTKWKEKYRIDDKFKIDDFIKNKSQVKRYTSDDYLKSIAKPEEKDEEEDEEEIVESVSDSNHYSDIGKQARAYSALLAIARKNNNLDEMFNWVHKNSVIRFNDEYKELILSAIYLQYSPKYLGYLKAPDIDILKSYLTLEDFKQLNDIKRYAIISYFNTLLPKEQAVTNNYFSNYIRDIYFKSKNAKLVDTLTVSEQESENEKPFSAELQIEEDIDSIETEDELPHAQETQSIELNADFDIKVEDNKEENKTENNNENKVEMTSSEIALDDLEKTSIYQIDLKKSNVQAQTTSVIEDDNIDYPSNKENEVIKSQAESEFEPKVEPEIEIETNKQEPQEEIKKEITVEIKPQETKLEVEPKINTEAEPQEAEPVIETKITVETKPQETKSEIKSEVSVEQKIPEPKVETKQEEPKEPQENKVEESKPEIKVETKIEQLETQIKHDVTMEMKPKEPSIKEKEHEVSKVKDKEPQKEKENENVNETEDIDVYSYSYMFYDQIYDYSVQAEIIQKIDESVKDYEEHEIDLENEISDEDLLIQRNKIDN